MTYLERRYLVLACRHYGKTTFVVWLASQIEVNPGVTWTVAYVVQADASDIYRAAGYREARTLHAVRRLMRDGAPRIMARPPVSPAALIDFCLECRRNLPDKHLTLVIDELIDPEIVQGETTPELRIDNLRVLLAVERGCNVIMASQYPASVPMAARQLAEEVYLGRIPHKAALLRLYKMGVPQEILRELPSQGVPPKPLYEFLTWQAD